jgi:phosphoribosylaminoimidazole (AIR) synthetase
MHKTLADFVGNTPLIQLKRLPGEAVAARGNVILAKLEGNNPAGSVKDRPALSMIRRAEQRGEIKPGDTLIGLRSSGCHSNGFSLLRKMIPDGPLGDGRARELLEPTRIYVKALSPLIQSRALKGLAHITGSGFLNVPRMSENVSYEIRLPSGKDMPEVYGWIRNVSQLGLEELAQTFNMGIGMIAVVPATKADAVVKALRRSGESAWIVGEVTRRRTGAKCSEVSVTDGSETVVLKY